MANYDYVVVGAGSAGCAVAARLSEDAGIHVAVLEAGSRQVPPMVAEDIAIPWHWGLVQNTPVDWGYLSVPQPHCCGRRFPEPRGQMPGGTSNLYIADAHPRAPQRLRQLGLQRLPGLVFRRRAALFPEARGPGGRHQSAGGQGRSAAGRERLRHDPNPVSRAFIEACVELGFPRTDDFNGPRMEGAGWHHVNIKDGKRHSMEDAYLYPALDREQPKPQQNGPWS